jgi:hypothetical protein
VEWDARFDSDPNQRWLVALRLHGAHYGLGSDDRFSAGAAIVWQPGGRVSLRLEPLLERARTTSQYADAFDDPRASATFGHRYAFADLDQTTLSSGRYTGYKELARPRSYAFTPYPAPGKTIDPDRIVLDPDGPDGLAAPQEIDDPNFSLASLRGNAVVRWEYDPGSTLFLVWTQNRSDAETVGSFRTGRAIGRLFDAKADNIFLVKVSYWWNP